MIKQEEYLRYGQIIRIHGNETGAKRGLIAVKGFTDLDAMYIVFEQFRNIEFYRQGLFQLLPRGVFEIHDEAQRTAQEKKKKESDDGADGMAGKPKKFQREDDNAESLARDQRLAAEKQQYQLIARAKRGELINFGDDVIFKHVDSGAYLSGSVRCSDGGLGSFKVELSESLSSILVFKLLPFRSYEKEGDPIKLLGPIRIKNIENRCYLSCENIDDDSGKVSKAIVAEPRSSGLRDAGLDQFLSLLGSEGEQQRIGQQPPPPEERSKLKKFNIVTTYSQSETWLIHLHEGHETLEDKDTVRNHDLIYLRHTQKEGYLASGSDGKPYLKELYDEKEECYSCIWQIEFLPLPRIEPPMEEEVGREETYCLRDILTSRQLELAEAQSGQADRTNQVRIVNAKGSTSSFRLRNSDLVKLYEIEADRQPARELDVGKEFKMKNPDDLQYMDELPYCTRELYLSNNQTEHGFRIIKVDDETKQEVLFVLSTYQVLNDFARQLLMPISRVEQQVKAKKLQLVDETLRKLIAFVKACSLKEIDQEILPKVKYQMILKDLEISRIIFSILESMGVKIREQLYKNYKKENELFKTVFNRCYEFILQIIRNNPVTKLYVSEEWLQTILRNAIQIEQHKSHVALNEILASNVAVVDKFLLDSLLSQILEVFILKPAHEKFLKILSSSCICNDKPIVKNQNKVLKQFFETLEDNITFKFIPEDNTMYQSIVDMRGTMVQPPMSMESDHTKPTYKVKIRSCISKSVEKDRALDVLFRESEESDCAQTWNYFLAFLNLLADICFGRNYKAKMFVQELLTKDLSMQMKEKWAKDEAIHIPVNDRANQSLYILCLILEDQDIHKLKNNAFDALRAILRLINYAFVDTVKQNPIVRLSRLRDYIAIQEGVEINRTLISSDNELLVNVMAFLQKQIEKFKSFQSADIKEKTFLETVLDLLKSSLISGYWQKYELMLDMLKSLLRILKNERSEIFGEVFEDDKSKTRKATREETEDQQWRFNIYKAEAKKPTPEAQRIIKCKMLACELIKIILDFRTDLRVSHCTLIFKRVLQTPAEYSQYATDEDRDITIGSDTESIISFDDDRRRKNIIDDLENPGVWEHQLARAMKERDELKEVTTDDMNLNLIMMELSIYQDPALIANSLTILKRIHQRLPEIFTKFTDVGLLSGEATQRLVEAVMDTRKKLTILQDENLLYSTSEETDNEVIKELTWMSHSCKLNFNLDNYHRSPESYTISRSRGGFSMFPVFSQRDDVHSVHQRLIKCLDIHYTLLRFLNMCHGRQTQTLAQNLLRAIYSFLVMLTKYNLEMKFEVAPWMPIIRSSIGKDIGALDLLYELYSNNKNNLHQEEDVEQLTEEICQLIEDHRVEDIYKSKLMNFFHCLIYYNEDVIKSNQGAILAKLQDSKKTKIYFKVDDTSDSGLNRANIERWLVDFDSKHGQLLYKRQAAHAHHPVEPMSGARSPLRRKATMAREIPLRDIFEVDLPPQLMYYITMFNIFSSLIEGDNKVNIGKCKQVHSYKFLLDLLCMPRAKSCYPLRRNVRAYINRLYYSDNDYENLNQHILNTEIPLIIDDLDAIIRIYLEEANLGRFTLAHPVRFQYFETYYYLYFEQILVTLHEILHKQKFKDTLDEELARNYSRGDYFLHFELMRIFERLRYLSNKYNNRFVKSFIRTVTDKIRSDYLEKFIVTAKQIFHKNEQSRTHARPVQGSEQRAPQVKEDSKGKKGNTQKRDAALKERSEILIKLLEQGQIDTYFKENRVELQKNYPLTFQLPENDRNEIPQQVRPCESQTLLSKLRALINPKVLGNESKTVFYNIKLSRLRKLLDKPSFRLYLEGEFNQGCTDLYRINSNSIQMYDFKIPFVSLKQFILTIVKINKEKPQALSMELKIFFFRILRRYIEERNSNHDGLKSVDEWSNKDWEVDSQKIEQAQKFLNESGIPELLIESLSYHQDLQLYNEIILFSIAFILGGNKSCQDSILKMLKQDKKNDVFLNIQVLIRELGKTIENFNKIKPVGSHGTSSFNFRLIDDYDSFETESRVAKRRHTVEPPGPHEIRLKALSAMVFKRVFRFLQLLCENDHQANKKYFLEQVDDDNVKKINSINMIEQATFEIRKLFKIMSKDIVSLPLSVLDFINEINQIPCEDNQKTLCKTTFFEDFCYMASYLSDKQNLKERRFVRIQGMNVQYFLQPLYEIYIKCVNIVICVMEGNDEAIYRELATKLENKFLMDIIKQNLEQMGVTVDQPGSEETVHNIINDSTEFMMSQQMINAINVLIIIKKIREFDNDCKLVRSYQLFLKQNRQMERIHDVLNNHILKIQIKSNNKKQTVYFPRHPILTQLSDETRDLIMLAVRRQTHTEKLVSLFEFKQEIFNEIEHNFTISRRDKVLGFRLGTSETQTLFDWSIRISMLINVLWLLGSNVFIEYQEVEFDGFIQIIISGLALIQVVFTGLYVVGYVNSKAVLAKCRADAASAENQPKQEQADKPVQRKDSNVKQLTSKPSLSARINNVFVGLITRFVALLMWIVQLCINLTPSFIKKFVYYLKILLVYDRSFKGTLAYAVISLLGLLYSHQFFLLHQIFIFTKIPILDNVFQAALNNPQQLMSVSLLGAVFIFVFCMLGYETYASTLHENPESECDSILGCTINLFVSGTLGSGVQQFEGLRFMYDMVYSVFFGILFSNIINGILTDALAELRSNRQNINTDKGNVCYICGIDRANLEKAGDKFSQHTRKDHFLWNYIFYLYCLQKKDQMDKSGLQYEISRCAKDPNDISWLPAYEDNNDDSQKKIEQIMQALQNLQTVSHEKMQELNQLRVAEDL